MTRRESRHLEASPSAEDLRRRVGANIRAARVACNLTNRELAALLDIDVRLLQKHVAGDNMPSEENLLKYARALGRTVSWFFVEHNEVAAA